MSTPPSPRLADGLPVPAEYPFNMFPLPVTSAHDVIMLIKFVPLALAVPVAVYYY